MATTLRIVGDSEKKSDAPEVTEAELLQAENQLRSEAKKLVQEISLKYWDLGRVLFDVYDGVPGGYRGLKTGPAEARTSLFEKWGYRTFPEYCEKEIGIQRRTGENLRFAYYWFSVQKKMPQAVIDDLVAIGRSKVYILAGFATPESIALWIEKAKTLTVEELKEAVRTAKALAATTFSDREERDQTPPPSASKDDEGDAPETKTLPPPEEWHDVKASLVDAQHETWKSAMTRAQSLTKSDKVGHNLELICQDFLSNNDFSNVQEKDRGAFISKMERRLGLLMIAIDPNTGKPVHGRDLLWRLLKEHGEVEQGAAE